MLRYIVKRLLVMIPVIICVAILIFSIMFLVPGDPCQVILGNDATDEALTALREQLGLDDPYIVQLARYLKQIFIDLDLGTSWFKKTTVTHEIINRFPRTVVLAFSSVILGALVGVPLGVTAAVHQNKLADRICMTVAVIFNCMPQFWVALLLVLVFSLKLGWFPAYGVGSFAHYVIPCTALMLGSFAGLSRQTRSSMLEVIRSDYVITARSQGFSERDIIYKHALPNALLPIITLIGTHFAGALGGTIVLEKVFSMPGIGLYISDAITARDYPVVRGCVVFLSILFSINMLLIDLVYMGVDPRIKAQLVGSKRKRKE